MTLDDEAVSQSATGEGWMPLRVSEHRDMLMAKFAVDVPEGFGWARGLSFEGLPAKIAPWAWVHLSTGNLLLIEWVGDENGFGGAVHAFLSIAATEFVVPLLPSPRRVGGSGFSEATQRIRAMQEVFEEVRPLVGLPSTVS